MTHLDTDGPQREVCLDVSPLGGLCPGFSPWWTKHRWAGGRPLCICSDPFQDERKNTSLLSPTLCLLARRGSGVETVPPVDQGQDVEHGCHVGVVVTGGLLQVLQRLLAEGDGHLVPALGRVLDDQVVQGSQAGRDLVASLLSRSQSCTVVLVLHCRVVTCTGQRSVRVSEAFDLTELLAYPCTKTVIWKWSCIVGIFPAEINSIQWQHRFTEHLQTVQTKGDSYQISFQIWFLGLSTLFSITKITKRGLTLFRLGQIIEPSDTML